MTPFLHTFSSRKGFQGGILAVLTGRQGAAKGYAKNVYLRDTSHGWSTTTLRKNKAPTNNKRWAKAVVLSERVCCYRSGTNQ